MARFMIKYKEILFTNKENWIFFLVLINVKNDCLLIDISAKKESGKCHSIDSWIQLTCPPLTPENYWSMNCIVVLY